MGPGLPARCLTGHPVQGRSPKRAARGSYRYRRTHAGVALRGNHDSAACAQARPATCGVGTRNVKATGNALSPTQNGVPYSSRPYSSVNSCGATIGSKSCSRHCAPLWMPRIPRHPRTRVPMKSCGSFRTFSRQSDTLLVTKNSLAHSAEVPNWPFRNRKK